MNDSEGGFTLIELLIVIVVLGIIIGTMTAAIIVGIRTTNQTIQRLSESHDAQNSAAYFVSDMQSAVTTTASADNGCNASPANSPLVSFEWKDYGDLANPPNPTDDVDEERIATYATDTEAQVVENETGDLIQDVVTLIRHFCTKPDGSGSFSLQESTRIASLVSPTSGPTVTCDPAGCASPVQTVEISATEASGFIFRLSARRRSASP